MARRGRKSKREDEELLAELREAVDNEPPESVVDRWMDAVRKAIGRKRGE